MSEHDDELTREELGDEVRHQDDVEIEDLEDTVQDKIKKLKAELKKCNVEKAEYLDGWQRTKADMVNSKKRADEEKQAFVAFATGNLIEDLLPVLESFEMAFKNKEQWESVPKEWRIGIEYIYNQYKSVLEANGLSEQNPLGDLFDPSLHNSIEMIEVKSKKDDGTIVEVVQKGYTLGDKVIKPAQVKVGTLADKE